MKKELLGSIFILAVLALVGIPYVILAPEHARKEAEKQAIIDMERQKVIAEKRAYLLGKFDPASNPNFVPVPSKYAVIGTKMYLRKETLLAFESMRAEALKAGITLNIASATRNFDYQKMLWENKWTGDTLVEGKKLPESTPDRLARFEKILEYSAAPSTSRHHWGTDIDINGADPAYFNTAKGIKEYQWLTENAARFGFCQTYNQKGENRPSGYNEEKWHWSYIPLASAFTSDYAKHITEMDIKGFAGEDQVKNLNLIKNYVLGINPECR